MNEASEKFEHWCIVELMGHQRVAGLVTEANLFGSALMRVDIPGLDGTILMSKYYGGGAIYAITPVEESVARAMAKAYEVRPVERWQLKNLLPEPSNDLATSEFEDRDYDSSYGD